MPLNLRHSETRIGGGHVGESAALNCDMGVHGRGRRLGALRWPGGSRLEVIWWLASVMP